MWTVVLQGEAPLILAKEKMGWGPKPESTSFPTSLRASRQKLDKGEATQGPQADEESRQYRRERPKYTNSKHDPRENRPFRE